MRNLKKFLALVLAMVMAMSLMVTANAATKSSNFPTEDINPDLVEAVDVLAGLGVFKGQNATGAEDAKPVFAPKSPITRKEVATLIYRVFSADVEDDKADLYKDYADFSDVNENSWYAGYVGLCANHGIIKGSNNGRFYPDNNVTGYEVLAMILRVVGYDEEGEFTGLGWQTRVASRAALLHITDNLNGTVYGGTLNDPANREVVAELIFQTMVRVPMVTHNSLGYNDKISLTSTQFNNNLGQEKFGLAHDWDWSTDKWGVPYYRWYKNAVLTGVGQGYDVNGVGVGMPIWGNSTTAVATIYPDPDMDFTTTMRECDVAHTLNYDQSKIFDLYVNQNLVEDYRIEATDTVTRVGGQGRHTRIWYGLTSEWFTGSVDNIVSMIDTYLAQVTRVTPRVLDYNNHVVQPARADLVVYDRGEAMPGSDRTNDKRTNNVADDTNPINFINDDTYATRCTNMTKGAYRSEHFLTSTTADYTYTVGQYILVQGKSDPSQGNDWTDRTANGDGTGAAITGTNTKTGLNHTGTQAQKEKMAFETNMLVAQGPAGINDTDKSGIAPVDGITSVDAKQTSVSWNNGTHNVGTSGTKDDQLTLFMDYAGSNLSNTFTWYFDQYGNLIGIGPKANTEKYGVITSLYAAFKQGSSATTGEAVAMAHVQYADKTEGDVAISRFFVTGQSGTAGSAVWATPDGAANAYGAAMIDGYKDSTGTLQAASNTVNLVPIYDYNGLTQVMQSTNVTPWTAGVDVTAFGGQLSVAPVAQINKDNDANRDGTHFGIIGYNMFKFITTEDGVVTAIEVAGAEPNNNTQRYDGHHHFKNADNTNGVGKLNKAQGSITTEQLVAGGNNNEPVWLDKNVKIILNRNKTLTVYNGLDELPSDITIDAGSEVDWADVNGDLRADYVYLYGETTGVVTYGLFYYNGGNAVWNGTSGTLTGWLNGAENTVLTFTTEAEFNAVRNSVDYFGHMFAVRLMDGVVDELMMTDEDKALNGTNWTYNLLQADGATITNTNGNTIDVDDQIGWGVNTTANTTKGTFVVGTPGGNPYDENTRVSYYSEGRGTPASNTAAAGADITYRRDTNQVYGTVTVNATGTNGAAKTYYVGANTKYYGIGMGAIHGEAVLEYLEKSNRNDVTIVYDVTNNGILEIYVATDPNITPSVEPVLGAYDVVLTQDGTAGTLNVTITWNDHGTPTVSGTDVRVDVLAYRVVGETKDNAEVQSSKDVGLDANGDSGANGAGITTVANSGWYYFVRVYNKTTNALLGESNVVFGTR